MTTTEPRPAAEPQSTTPGFTRPLIVAFWTYAAGYVPLFAARLGSPIPPWVMPLIGVAAGLIGARLARLEWSPRLLGDRHLCEWAEVLAVVTGVAMSAWFVFATIATPLHAAMWLALGALPLGGWYWFLHRWALKLAADTMFGTTPGTLPPTDPEWTKILESAGFAGLHVRAEPNAAGATLTVRPNPLAPVTTDDLWRAQKTIAMRIALAKPEIEIREDDVRIEPAPVLPNILVHVSWKRPLKGTLAYTPAGPTTIAEPRPLGVDEVGATVAARLAGQNGMTVSATGGGKTVETNVKIGRITECRDALVWIGATDKLLPLVYPWLQPWLSGLTDRPLIDWVAGQRGKDVLDMLADVYAVVRLRNARNARKSKHVASPDSPALIVFIEEATDLARRRDKVRTFDGRVWTASQLFERICATDRSAGVAIYFLAQAALVDALGQYGSEIMRNVKMRTCGVTMSSYDGSSTLPGLRKNVDTTRLRDNTLLMQPNNEDPRIIPWKAFHLEDDHMIEPVVIANTPYRPAGIEPEIARQLRSYRGRWDDGRLPDIVRECEAEGFAWPGTTGEAPPDDTADDEDVPMAAARTAAPPADFDAQIDATETISKIEAATAALRARILPSPLDEIARLLESPKAGEFITTRKLALMLDRVDVNAPDEEIEQAARAVGNEVSAALPKRPDGGPVLKTVQRRIGGGRKRWGYDVARLRGVLDAIRAGQPIPDYGDESA